MNEEKIAPKLTNVFVLMLENHSFDNIFAMSCIPGITAATVKDFNFVEGKKYFVQDGAPWCMTTDPGHEFDDVLEQLCGYDAARLPRRSLSDDRQLRFCKQLRHVNV